MHVQRFIMKQRIVFILLLIHLKITSAARHNISLKNEDRRNIPLSTFGFFQGGKLIIDIKKFVPRGKEELLKGSVFGFSLQDTKNDGISSYMEKTSKKCVLEDLSEVSHDMKMVLLKFDMPNNKIIITKRGDKAFRKLSISKLAFNDTKATSTFYSWLISHWALLETHLLKFIKYDCRNTTDSYNKHLPLNKVEIKEDGKPIDYFSAKIEVSIDCPEQEGLYNLYFHNCLNYQNPGAVGFDLDLLMIEHNRDNFLSAGEMALPPMYGFMSCCFFVAAFVWTVYIHRSREWTYKIHWLMAAVVYIKALSVAFHAINYYYIGKGGLHVTTWAVLFYVIHLLKGALLFTAIIFIGTGYFFVKHVFSSKEKKLFMLVIPLQVVLNVAQIIIDSTEEGQKAYRFWTQAAILIDLLCCGAILLPVIWSVKHLTEAAKTDGKAAISLTKLKLFRQFYLMIVCYIYFTRIIVYLIKITVPFQYMWLDEFFTEAATYFFFILTGFKFRPVNDNPYLHLAQDDREDCEEPDIEMSDISVHSSYSERLTRVNTQAKAT